MGYVSRVEKAYPPLGQMVEVGNTSLHVIRRGNGGPPVVMIHGASANAREFTVDLAPRLEGEFSLFLPDRPGHGYSDRHADAQALGVQAGLIAEMMAQETNGDAAVVIGHSFGGAVALRLALDHPEKVKGLVLLAPVSHDWGGGGVAWYNQMASPPVIGHAFSWVVPIFGPSRIEEGLEATFYPDPVPEGYGEASAVPLIFRPSVFRANARDLTALLDELSAQESRYGQLDLPIIVFSGEQDTVIKPELHVYRLREQAPDVRIVSLADSGHMPHHAVPDQVVEAIRSLALGPDAS